MPEPSHCLSDCPGRKQQELSVTSLSTGQTGKGGGIVWEMRSCVSVMGKRGEGILLPERPRSMLVTFLGDFLGAFKPHVQM